MAAELRETKRSKNFAPIRLPTINDIPRRAKEIQELIARRAYTIYESRGHVDGHDREDWLQAESEVLAPLFVGLIELNDDLTVNLGITTCELPQLRVSVEPFRLIVSGKRKVSRGKVARSYPDGKPRGVEIFHVVDFPVQVEPSRAEATLSNGLLQLRIPKTRKTERSFAAKAA